MIVYRFAACEIDERQKVLTHSGAPVALGLKAAEMLFVLLRANGAVVSQEDLIAAVWPEGFASRESLWQSIRAVRKVLDPLCGAPSIGTVSKRGYRFLLPVERVVVGTPAPTPAQSPSRPQRFLSVFRPLAALLALLLVPIASPRFSQPLRLEDQQLDAVAHYNLTLRTVPSLTRAVAEFEVLVSRNPRNAVLLSGLAESKLLLGDYSAHFMRIAPGSDAPELARRAVMLDSSSAEALAALGLAKMMEGDGGSAELASALKLDPRSENAHLWYGIALLRGGHVEAARTQLRVAQLLAPTSAAAAAWLAQAAYYAHDYAQVEAMSRHALEIDPRREDGIALLGLSYELRNEFAMAAERYRDVAKIDSRAGRVLLAHLSASRGDVSTARRLMHSIALSEAFEQEYAQDTASAYAAIGERQTALAVLRAPRRRAHIPSTLDSHDIRLAALQ